MVERTASEEEVRTPGGWRGLPQRPEAAETIAVGEQVQGQSCTFCSFKSNCMRRDLFIYTEFRFHEHTGRVLIAVCLPHDSSAFRISLKITGPDSMSKTPGTSPC